MRRALSWAVLSVVGWLALPPTPAFAPNGHLIDVADNAFTPDDTRIAVSHGNTESPVHWTWCPDGTGTGSCAPGTDNPHNVREDHRLFSSGAPVEDRAEFNRHFSAGTFHYYCEVHGSPNGGMDGVVRVDLKLGPGPEGLPFSVRWAGPLTRTGNVFDVRFRVNDGPWKQWKTDTSAFAGTFGRRGNPVPVNDLKEYDFQARSQKNAQADGARSLWSPILQVEP